MKKNSGFTLLELLITVAVLALVMAIGIPSMTTFIQNDRLTTQINTLVGHLSYARSEAVKRSQQVAVCASTNGTSCSGGVNWETGWIIYVDVDGDSAFDAGEPILRAQQLLDGSNTLKPLGCIGSQATYDNRGFIRTNCIGEIGGFSLCDSRGATYGKQVNISRTGRVRHTGVISC